MKSHNCQQLHVLGDSGRVTSCGMWLLNVVGFVVSGCVAGVCGS